MEVQICNINNNTFKSRDMVSALLHKKLNSINNNKVINLTLLNYEHCGKYSGTNINIDFSKASEFMLDNQRNRIVVSYNPQNKGFLIDKTRNKPFEVYVLSSYEEGKDKYRGFHFVSKDLKTEYGFVTFEVYKNPTEEDIKNYGQIMRDYKNLGIVGSRVLVSSLRNRYKNLVGGVGILSDKVIAQYCAQIGIEPNIVSYATPTSQIAHYNRGKRFLAPEKNSPEYAIYKYYFNTLDPNKIVEERIKQANGGKVSTKNFEVVGMYLPKNIAYKYISELKGGK